MKVLFSEGYSGRDKEPGGFEWDETGGKEISWRQRK